jgi:hypothetical protein
MTSSPPSRELNQLEWLSVSYLCLPILVFLLGWLRWPYALILGLLTLIGWATVSHRRTLNWPSLNRWGWLGITIVACAWVALSGLVSPFFLNADWLVRMSVLRDLTVGGWPVGYGTLDADHQNLLLRLPMGYYLVPALLGKVLGGTEAAGRWMLALWTVLGAFLFLAMTVANSQGEGRWRGLWIPLLLAVGFSGMDVIGGLVHRHGWPPTGAHIEWWAELFQYSSNTTQLFWVPNHSLPGWIAGLLIWRHREQGLSLGASALLMLGVVTWAPLVAVGLAPLLFVCSLRGQTWMGWVREWGRLDVLALLLPGFFMARFITFGVPSEAAGTLAEAGPLGPVVARLVMFSLLEWALLAWVIFRAGERSWVFWLAAAELLLLPLLRFGPGNDIVMRGGIPALTIMMCAAMTLLSQHAPKHRSFQWATWFILAAGAVTPYQEISRVLAEGDRFESQGQTFIQINGAPWHYVGQLPDDSWMGKVLELPALLLPVDQKPHEPPCTKGC